MPYASTGYLRTNLYVLSTPGASVMPVQEKETISTVALQTNATADILKTKIKNAKIQGFEGDACQDCGNFTLVRNGTCLKCNTCGSTSGCS